MGRGRRAREGNAKETVPWKGRGERRREVVGDNDRGPIKTDRGLDCPGESAGDPVADHYPHARHSAPRAPPVNGARYAPRPTRRAAVWRAQNSQS